MKLQYAWVLAAGVLFAVWLQRSARALAATSPHGAGKAGCAAGACFTDIQ